MWKSSQCQNSPLPDAPQLLTSLQPEPLPPGAAPQELLRVSGLVSNYLSTLPGSAEVGRLSHIKEKIWGLRGSKSYHLQDALLLRNSLSLPQVHSFLKKTRGLLHAFPELTFSIEAREGVSFENQLSQYRTFVPVSIRVTRWLATSLPPCPVKMSAETFGAGWIGNALSSSLFAQI